MKDKGLQRFRTLDAISVFALLGTVLIIVGGIIYNNSSESHEVSARKSMLSLTSQLIAGGIQMSSNNALSQPGRAPASVLNNLDLSKIGGPEGRIGRDPWGQAFHYKVVKTDQVGFVVLISGGPDGQIQTDYTKIHAGPNGHLLGALFNSDDIGTVKKIQ